MGGTEQRISRRLRLRRQAALWAAAAVASLAPSRGARAANVWWDLNGMTAGASAGTTASGTWTTSTSVFNWTTSSAGAIGTKVWVNGDSAIFSAGTNATGSSTVTLATGQAISVSGISIEEGSITINPGTGTSLTLSTANIDFAGGTSLSIAQAVGGSAGLALNGGALTLSGSNTYTGGTTIGGFFGSLTISSDANLGNASTSLTFATTGGGGLITTASFSTSRSIICSGSAGNFWTLQSGTTVTSNGVISGTSGLTVLGPGTLVLTANNTVTNNFVVDSSGTTLLSAGSLSPSTCFVGDQSGANTFTQTGGTHSPAALSIGGQLGVTGTYNLSSGSLSPAGYVSVGTIGNGTFNHSGGTFTVSGDDLSIATVAGDTGTYNLSGTGSLSINNGRALIIGAGGNGRFIQTGGNAIVSGRVTVSNVGSSGATFSGGTFSAGSLAGAGPINTGINLTIGSDGSSSTYSGVMSGAGGFTKTGAGTLTMSGSDTYSGGTTITRGVVKFTGSASAGTGTITVGTASPPGSGGIGLQLGGGVNLLNNITVVQTPNNQITLSLDAFSGSAATLSGNITLQGDVSLQPAGSASLVVAGNISDGAANFGVATFGSPATVVLSGNNSYHGPTTINTGTLALGSDTALPATTSLTVNPSTTFDLNGHSATVGFLVGSGALKLNGPSLTVNSNLTATTYAGVISGSGNLIKGGAQTLIIAGTANTYAGKTSVTGGTLTFSNVNALGANPASLVPDYFSLSGGGTLQLTFSSSANPSTGFSSSNRGITIGSGGGTIDVASGNTVANFAGISGSGTLTKAGAGQLNLRAANAFTGKFFVSAGTLDFNNSTVFGGASGPDVITLNGLTTLSESTSIGATSIASTKGITLGGGPATIATPNGNQTLTINSAITGTGALIKSGVGAVVLAGTGANTNTATTTVAAGTLSLAKPNNVDAVGGNVAVNSAATLLWQANEQIPNSATLTLNSGGTLNLNGHSETVGSFVDNGGSTILGGGHLLTGGDLVLADGTIINSNTTVAGNLAYIGTVTRAQVNGNLTFSASTVTWDIADGADVPDVVLAGTLTHGAATGVITKTGAGTLELSGTGSSVGQILVSAGGLSFTGGSLTTSHLSFVESGGSMTAGSLTDSGTGSFLGDGSNNSVTFAHSGGTFTTARLMIGRSGSSGGVYNLSGSGTLSVTGPLGISVGNFGVGTFNQSGGTVATTGLNVAANGGSSSYNLSAGTLTASGLTSLVPTSAGSGTVATFTQTGGTANLNGGLSIAGVAGTFGTYNLTGTGALSSPSGTFSIGNGGTGTFNQSGGTATANSVSIGSAAGGNGTYNLSGGTLTVSSGALTVGAAAPGTLNLSAGGSLALTGGNDLLVGSNAIGSVVQSGGSATLGNTLWLGVNPGITGSYSMSGGSLAAVGEILAVAGTATFVQTAGTNTLSSGSTFILASQAGAQGFYTLSGGNLIVTGESKIGNSGFATFTHNGGSHNITTDLSFGYFAGSTGTYALSSDGVLTVGGNENIGRSGSGFVTQTGGTNAVAGDIRIAMNGGAVGDYTLSGNAVASAANIYVGGDALNSGGGVGTITVNPGATLSTSGTLKIWSSGATATKVNLAGGTLSFATLDTDGSPSRLNWTAGTLRIVTNDFEIGPGPLGGPLGGGLTVGAGKSLVMPGAGQTLRIGTTGSGSLAITGGGTANVAGTVRVGLADDSVNTITIGSGSSLTVGGRLLAGDTNDATVTVNTGGQLTAGALDVGVASIAANGTVNVNAGGSLVVAGNLNLGGSDAGQGGAGTLAVGAGATVAVGGTTRVWGDLADQLAVNANGSFSTTALTLNGFSSSHVDQGATLTVGAGGLTTDGASLTVDASGQGTGTLALGGDVTYAGGVNTAVFISDALVPGKMDLLAGQRTFNIADGSQATDLRVQACLTNGGITKAGGGVMSLDAANDYSGPTLVNAGRLDAAAGALPSATAVSVNGNATLNLLGSNTIGSLAGTSATGAVALNGFVLTVGDDSSTTYAGTINGGGSGALIKQGSGSLTLASGITGAGVTVNLGTLRLASPNLLLGGVVTVTGTGPTNGTLALPADNLGSASLSLPGGKVLFEGSMSLTRTITLDVGGGTMEVTPANTVEINSVLAGSGGLTKTGAGTLGLGCANTYMGQTFISAGTLATRVSGAIPTDSEVALAAGALLSLNSHNANIASIAGGGDISIGSATLTVGNNDATTDFSGAINGGSGGALAKTGLGTLTLSGSMSFSGGITVNAGELAITGTNNASGGINVTGGGILTVASAGKLGASANAVTLNDGTLAATGTFTSANPVALAGAAGGTFDVAASQTLLQSVAITGSATLNKTGDGTLRLDDPHSASGPVVVARGRLLLAKNAAMTSAASFTVRGGGTLELDNSSGYIDNRIAAGVTLGGGTFKYNGANAATSSESAGVLQLTPGASSIVLQQGGNGGATVMTFAGLGAQTGATLDVAAPGAGVTNSLFFTAQPAGFLGGWLTVNATDFARYDNSLGVVPVSDYTTTFNPGNNLRFTANGSAPPLAVIQSLSLDASSAPVTLTLGGAMDITSGGLLKFGGNPAAMTGGSVTSAGGKLYVNTAGGDLTIASAVTGSVNLIKSGAGLLELTSASQGHTFAGGIYLNAGTLRVAADARLGNSGNDLFFNGGTLQTTATFSLASGRTLTFAAGAGGTLDVASGATLTLAGDSRLAGAGPMTKSGSGTLSIAGNNSYAGNVTVAQGTLLLPGNSGALGSTGSKSRITLAPSTTLDLRSDGPYPANFANDVVVQNNSAATAATINTGPVSNPPNTVGTIQLGGLKMGDAQLNTGGTGGSLEFTGIVTLTGNGKLNTGRDLLLSDRVTGGGSITKLGTATMTFGSGSGDTRANTYAGLTTIAGGTLQLNKAAGTTAIPGDISMSGGTLILLQPRQIADSSSLLLGGGTFDINGKDDAVLNLVNNGASVLVNGGSLTVSTMSINGGITIIGAPPAPPGFGGGSGGGPVEPPGNLNTGESSLTSTTTTITDGTVTVNPGGALNIGSGGLVFDGTASPTVTLVSSSSTPGKIVLAGDVTNNCPSGTAAIVNSGAIPIAGTIELGDAQRTFTVKAASDLSITGRLSKGTLRKSGNGTLILTAAGDYAGGTTIADGIIEARDGALGTGPITMAGGHLYLRTDAATSRFGNDLSANDGTIDIGRVTAGTTGTIQLGRLAIGSSRLRFTGATGGAVEFTGAATLSGSSYFEDVVAVQFSNAIGGAGSFTKDTGGGTITFGGSVANTYTGETRVNAGTLVLGKPAAVNAVAGANLSVFTGGVVRWMNNDQVPDTSALNVNGSSSQMDLNGFSDTIATVSMSAGTLATGAGTLHLGTGGVSSAAATVTATISGNLDLGALTRTVNVADGDAADDLNVSANVSGAGGINKTGGGVLVLSGNNSFTGGVSIAAGSVRSSGGTSFAGSVPLNVSSGTFDLPGSLSTAPSTVMTKTGAGTLTVRGTQNHGAGAQLLVQQGTVNLNTDAGSASKKNLAISATGGSVALGVSQHLASLSVASGVTTTLAPGNRVIVADSLSVSGSGKLDLADGDLVVTSAALGVWNGTNYTGALGLVASARNGGSWNGAGITTSQNTAGGLTTLAVATAQQALNGSGVFAGQTVGAGSLLVTYTYGGDANLDGKINVDDYGKIDFNVNLNTNGWFNGDFNYDGKINVDDYGIIDFNVGIQGSKLGGGAGAASAPLAGVANATAPELSTVSAVPEPLTLAPLLGIGAGALLRRRRKK